MTLIKKYWRELALVLIMLVLRHRHNMEAQQPKRQ